MNVALPVSLALFAALCFAVSAVLQQRAASSVPDSRAADTGLIRVLIHTPLWWAGVGVNIVGFAAQAAALGFGSLLLVEPMLVTTLLFALPLGARWSGRRLGIAEWTWAVLLALALVAFVLVGEPTAGTDQAPIRRWLLPLAVLVAGAVLCVALARRNAGVRRALLLAAATAVSFGITAAMTMGVVDLLDNGLPALLTNFEPYALAVSVLAGTWLQQAAFQAGSLAASLPTFTVGEPVLAAVLGVTVLGEYVRTDGAEWALLAVILVIMATATIALARMSARHGAPAVRPVRRPQGQRR